MTFMHAWWSDGSYNFQSFAFLHVAPADHIVCICITKWRRILYCSVYSIKTTIISGYQKWHWKKQKNKWHWKNNTCKLCLFKKFCFRYKNIRSSPMTYIVFLFVRLEWWYNIVFNNILIIISYISDLFCKCIGSICGNGSRVRAMPIWSDATSITLSKGRTLRALKNLRQEFWSYRTTGSKTIWGSRASYMI